MTHTDTTVTIILDTKIPYFDAAVCTSWYISFLMECPLVP